MAALLTLAGCLGVGGPSPAAADPRASAPPSAAPARPDDLPRLTAELARVTAHAQALAGRLDDAAARDGGLRVALQRAQTEHEQAQWQLDSRARTVFMTSPADPLAGWQVDLAQPDLRVLAQRGQRATLQVDRSLIDAVAGRQSSLQRLRTRAAGFRSRLLAQAAGVLADQDRARDLLARASDLAARSRSAGVQSQLAEQKAVLDTVSAAVTSALRPALTPARTVRPPAAASSPSGAEQGVEALLEATGPGIPRGYALTGQSFSGTASWYGPGFIGLPTASGAPYDPERLTCANKQVPLGTVLHVSANGRSVNCLVNDRGPYVGDRVLDMSRAGSRALGYDGLAEVVVQVLAPR